MCVYMCEKRNKGMCKDKNGRVRSGRVGEISNIAAAE